MKKHLWRLDDVKSYELQTLWWMQNKATNEKYRIDFNRHINGTNENGKATKDDCGGDNLFEDQSCIQSDKNNVKDHKNCFQK